MIAGIIAQQGMSPVEGFAGADFMADGPTLLLSLRKLNPAYSGNCLRVRRSSDNTTLDVGFNGAGELDTAALLAFVGSGSGFVNIWYDQSGSGNNWSQSTLGAQPRIVNAGVLDTFGGRPAIWMVSNTTGLVSATYHFLHTAQTVIFSFKRDASMAGSYTGVIGTDRTSRMGLGFSNIGHPNVQQLGSADKTMFDPWAGDSNGINTRWSVMAFATRYGRGANNIIDIQNTLDGSHGINVALGGMGGTPSQSYIGSNAQTGYIHELVAYPSFLPTQNRKTLEQDMCVRVGVSFRMPYFTPSNPYGVAGIKQVFALRKLVPEYNGPCISIYNGSVRANIGFDGSGNLDMTALAAYNTGSNDITIEAWHNQMGDGNSLANDSVGARIVTGGVLQTIDGTHPGIDFDSSRWLHCGWSPILSPHTFIAAIYPRSTAAYHSVFSQQLSSAQFGFGWQPGGLMAAMCNGVTHTISNLTVTNTTKQIIGLHAAAGWTGGVYAGIPFLNGPDGTAFSTNYGGRTAYRNFIRYGDTIVTADRFLGRIGEFILTDRELDSTDRYAVQNSMGAYYGITIT